MLSGVLTDCHVEVRRPEIWLQCRYDVVFLFVSHSAASREKLVTVIQSPDPRSLHLLHFRDLSFSFIPQLTSG